MRSKPKCRKCGHTLRVGRNWSSGRRKHYDKTCNRCHATQARKFAARNPTSGQKASARWRSTNRATLELRRKTKALLTRIEVFKHYSNQTQPQCANPFNQHAIPYTDMRALTIDHIHGGGTKHRFETGIGGGHHFYRWLKQQGFPVGYQILCMNCQFIKRVKHFA